MAGRAQLIGVIAGLVLGVLLFSMAARYWAGADLDRAGMGRNTVPRSGELGELRVSAVGQPEEIFPVWRQFREQNLPVALWLGASQIYCINNIQSEDRLAVEYVNQWAIDENVPLRMTQLTAPNGNLHELLSFYLACRQAGYRPDWLVIGLVYDDLREETIRPLFLEAMGPLDDEILAIGGEGMRQLKRRQDELASEEESGDPVARNPTTGTPQARLESALVRQLDAHFPGYANRNQLTGQFKITIRAGLARMLGQVSQRRVAPVPEARKAWNHRALEALVQLARADGVKVLIYQPPHRPGDGPFYHDREKYDGYFAAAKAWCDTMADVHFLDLETLVPQPYWGVTNWGRPDVFHFTVEGHRRLANAIAQFFQQRQEANRALQ